jgi:hypothetical protein
MSYICNEVIDLENLHKLLESSKVSVDHKLFLRKLQQHLKKSATHTLEFQCTEKIKGLPAGRLYAKYKHPSLQVAPRILRGALGPEYVEIDIVNCFPSIFLQIFQKNNIRVPVVLREYVADREAFVTSTGYEKDEVKRAMSAAMNFGSSHIHRINNFAFEFRESFRDLCFVPFYKKYYEFGKMRAQAPHPDEPYKRAVHWVGADIERQIVLSAIKTFSTAGYETSTVIHDGFLVRCTDDMETFQLKVQDELNQAASDVLEGVGYQAEFSVKELVFNPSDLFDEHCASRVEEELSDHRAAEIFAQHLEEMQYIVRKCRGELYMYDPNTHIWTNKIDGWRKVCAMCEELGEHGKSTVRQNAMWVQFEDGLEDNENLMFDFADKAYLKMAFNNGYFDFRKQEFVLFDDISDAHECGFTYKIKYDWDMLDTELQEQIWSKCIKEVYGEEQGKFLLAVLGRAAAGYVEDKMLYIILGNTNSGKGVMVALMEKAFGKGYVGTFNTGVLQHKHVADEAKGLSFMVALKDKRFLVGSEASRAAVFDSQKINMLCSGGDTICARQNNKDEMEFKMAGTTFMFCNDMSKINGLDDSVANRLRFIEPRYSFLAGAEYERKKHQPNIKLADDSIKTHFVKREDVGLTFAMMVCLAYADERPKEPSQVVQNNSDWLNNEDISEVLGRMFVPEVGNLLVCEDFYKACQDVESLRHVSLNKITRTMANSFGITVKFTIPTGGTVQKRCYVDINFVVRSNPFAF